MKYPVNERHEELMRHDLEFMLDGLNSGWENLYMKERMLGEVLEFSILTNDERKLLEESLIDVIIELNSRHLKNSNMK